MYPTISRTQLSSGEGRTRVYLGGAVRDAAGVRASPGAVAVRDSLVLAAGAAESVLAAAGPRPECFALNDRLLMPGLVNAHAHLDLTGLGYRAFHGDFPSWGDMVGRERRAMDAAGHARGVVRGAAMSLACGVFTVGDIAGDVAATDALINSGLRGVSFVEMFGLGDESVDLLAQRLPARYEQWLARNLGRCVRLGWQPHSPYSAGKKLFEDAAMHNAAGRLPICTHLAELKEELEFVASASGACRKFLESLGKWDDRYLESYGKGMHPLEWLLSNTDFPKAKWLLAHCNYVEDSHITLMARHGSSVAYCPRASEYFGHRNHRYRAMLAAGVNVCLGTDSIICHGSLSILDEMRRLYQRDRTDPGLLLKMATVNGMRGLQMDERDATFAAGANPGIIAIRYDPGSVIDPLTQVVATDESPDIEVLEGVEMPKGASR